MAHRGRRAVVAACIAGLAFLGGSGCGPAPVRRSGVEVCGRLDSLYVSCGFARPLSIGGQVTVDANQYKVRGKIRLDVRGPGEVVIEFTSSVLFGHARQDVVFSSVGDTIRIVDREHGAYYEGWEAEAFLAESFETDLDVRRVLWLAFGGHPPCDELSDVHFSMTSRGEVVCAGDHLGGRFRVVCGADRRVREVEWPVWSDRYGPDRLRVAFDWESGVVGEWRLRGLDVYLYGREWRCRIRSAG